MAPRNLALGTISATRQTGRAEQAVGSGPAVRVLDGAGEPVAGVRVVFSVAGGGGAVEPASTLTARDGIARATWRLGAGGPQLLEASAPELDVAPLVFSADVLPSSGYAIDLRLRGTASDWEWEALTGAAARIAQVVVGELPPADLSSGPSCDGTIMDGSVQNLLILVRIHPVDGAGGVLGQAAPCILRSGSRLPAVGVIELDDADLSQLQAAGTLRSVVLHELLHVVGYGTIWTTYARSPLPPLLAGESSADPVFTGDAALAAALARNGAPAAWAEAGVPLEDCGEGSPRPCGSGTRDVHWREPIFGDELMTGWLTGTTQPLSATTVGSLADMGYQVNLDAADPFSLASPAPQGEAGPASRAAAMRPGAFLGDDVLRIPVVEVP